MFFLMNEKNTKFHLTNTLQLKYKKWQKLPHFSSFWGKIGFDSDHYQQ